MGVARSSIDAIRERIDITDVLAEHTSLKQVGSNWMALCVFHSERSPSMSVNAQRGVYHCFGCGASGDVISLVRGLFHLDFGAAVEMLAARINLVVEHDTDGDQQRYVERHATRSALNVAAQRFHQILLSDQSASDARTYLRGRGLDGDMVRRWQLGYVTPKVVYELRRQISDTTWVNSGLGTITGNDRKCGFTNRVIFPVHDLDGNVAGFGARRVDSHGPKYLNSPESVSYHKSRLLYGLWQNRVDIVNKNRVIVVEGYTDVIQCVAAGYSNVVATCGTALTSDHLRILNRFVGEITVVFDSDAAGENATSRLLNVTSGTETKITVVRAPNNMDPAEWVTATPTGLREALDDAEPLLGWVLNQMLSSGGRDIEDRVGIAQKAVQLVTSTPNRLLQRPYLDRIAQKLQLDPTEIYRLATKTTPHIHAQNVVTPRPAHKTWETDILAVAAAQPEQIKELLPDWLLTDPSMRAAYQYFTNTTHGSLDELDTPIRDAIATAIMNPDMQSNPVDIAARATLPFLSQQLETLIQTGQATDPDWFRYVTECTKWAKQAERNLTGQNETVQRETLQHVHQWILETPRTDQKRNVTDVGFGAGSPRL